MELEPRAALEVMVVGEGRRLEGADVVLWVDNENVFRSDTSSGPDGMVPMRGLPPGTYSLVATHRDYLPSERRKVEVADGQTLRVTVTLEPGAVLDGEVVDGRGVPVAEASVSVLPRTAESVVTDARGRFEVRALKPGRPSLVEARHARYDQRERVQGTAGGERVRVVMEAREVFSGRVVASDGNRPAISWSRPAMTRASSCPHFTWMRGHTGSDDRGRQSDAQGWTCRNLATHGRGGPPA